MFSRFFLAGIATIAFFVALIVIHDIRQPKMNPTTDEHPSSHQQATPKTHLTAEQYHILYEGGTETPFTSPLLHEKRAGTYVTADCQEPVFRSEQKFDSGTGWPSFWAPISGDAITHVTDTELLVERTEVRSRCGEHLGHVFDDGPAPTGLRYCINGDALIFIPDSATSSTSTYEGIRP